MVKLIVNGNEMIRIDSKVNELVVSNNWISVKDKLPPLNTDVLVLVQEPQKKWIPYDSRMKVAHMYERMLSDYSETEESIKDILRWNILDTVTHWIELPNAPEESEYNIRNGQFVYTAPKSEPLYKNVEVGFKFGNEQPRFTSDCAFLVFSGLHSENCEICAREMKKAKEEAKKYGFKLKSN